MALVLRVTCARDGREHLVAEELMTPGSAGRYVALCGHRLLAAVLACPPGPSCPTCIAVHKAATGGRRSRRTDRPGVWACLNARLRGRRRGHSRPRHASAADPLRSSRPRTGGTGDVPTTVAGPAIHRALGGRPPRLRGEVSSDGP